MTKAERFVYQVGELSKTEDVVRLPSRTEARAAGKGGQFAKGGGRVPAGAGRFGGMTATEALNSVSDQEATAIYGTFEHEGFTSRVDSVVRNTNDGETYGGSIGVSGAIIAPDGAVVGRFSRIINPQPRVDLVEATRTGAPQDPTMTLEVHHDVFFLNKAVQGHGVGGAFIEQTMTKAKEAGIERVTVHALSSPGKSNGALVWAKEGFEMRQGSDSLAIRMRARLKGEAMRHLPAEARTAFQALSARVLKGKASMSELLATPDGVAVLLGENGTVTWDGAMRL